MLRSSRNRSSPVLFALSILVAGLFWVGGMDSALAIAPNTQIVLDDGDVTVQPGDLLTYTIQISSAVTATNVVITQTVPADVHFQTCEFQSPLFGSCTPLTSAVRLELSPVLAPSDNGQVKTTFVVGQNVDVDIDSNVEMRALDEHNTALPTATVGESTPVHVPKPFVTVELSDNKTNVQPGDAVSYVLTVKNGGDATAQDIQLTAILPDGLHFESASDGGTENPSGVVKWSHFNLVVNDSIDRTFDAVVDLPIDPLVTELSVTATVTFVGAPSPAPSTSDVDSVASATFSGRLWHDNNGNGIFDSELGIDGAEVQALSSGLPVVTVAANAQGEYLFAGMPLRRFLVEPITVTLPNAVKQTFESDGTLDGSLDVDVSSGVQIDAADFGFAAPASIADSFAWTDLNTNGSRDLDESGLAGIRMSLTFAGPDGLLDTADDQPFSTTTGPDGRYGFDNLTPGAYRLAHDPASVVSGYRLTTYPQGAADALVHFSLTAGQQTGGLDFGFAALDLSIGKSTHGIEAVTSGILPYSITYANIGLVDAQQVLVTEIVPESTTFLPDASHPGWLCPDGFEANSQCNLALGNVPTQTSGIISFTVVVQDSMPAHVNTITNTVQIADLLAQVPDPTAHNNQFVLTSPIGAAADLIISQSDGNTRTEPGKTLIYAMEYANQGNQAADGVEVSILVPANTTFNAAAGTPGWHCPDGSSVGTACTMALGTVVAGAEGNIDFAMTVNSTMPVNVASLTSEVLIRDDIREHDRDGELTPVDATPDLILVESDDQPLIQPGETVKFTLNYFNTGNRDAIGVLILEKIPHYARFNEAASTPGWDCPDGIDAGESCVYSIGALPANNSGTVVFAVTVAPSLPAFVTEIENSAVIAGSGIELDIRNNQTSSSVDVLQPTAVDLVSFTATVQGETHLQLEWFTSAERDSWGFLVHRSTDPTWENAVRINPHMIESTGDRENGAYYTYFDTTALSGVIYYYWLQELEINSSTNVYGPISGRIKIAGETDPTADKNSIFIPLILR